VELAAQREADAELEALRTLVVRVRDLVLDGADGPSFLAASMSMVAELLNGQINAVAASEVRLGVPFYVGCHRVTFPKGEDRAGGA
jgi:hypothetical protein